MHDYFQQLKIEPSAPVTCSPLDGMVLTLPDTIVYKRGVKAKPDEAFDITVEYDDGLIIMYSPNKAIELAFKLDELRAIMRLFDPARASVPQDEGR